MSEKKQDFNQSLKYALHLRKADPYFIEHMYYLISKILHYKKIREHDEHWNHRKSNGRYYNEKFTCLKPIKYLLNKDTSATKDGKDYRLYNLTLPTKLDTYRTFTSSDGKELLLFYGFSLWFKNKIAAKDCIKELGIKKSEIFFSGWIDKHKRYEVAFVFKSSIFKEQFDCLEGKFISFFERNRLRYNGIIRRFINVPSSIYDRWYDLFAQKVMNNSKEIRTKTGKSIDYQTLIIRLNPIVSKYEKNSKSYSRINYFISNQRYVDKIRDKTLYITNHYINKYNPYKTKDTRKDWKFAAEQYLNEILGKFKYHQELYRDELKNADCNELTDLNSFTNDKCAKFEDYTKGMWGKASDMWHLLDETRFSIEDKVSKWKKEIEKYSNLLIKDISERTLDEVNELNKVKLNEENETQYIENNLQHAKEALDFYLDEIEMNKKKLNEYVKNEVKKAKIKIKANKDNYLALFFSKKETELFIRNLNLKTKISAKKLRKIVLDELCRLDLLVTDGTYEVRKSCRVFHLKNDKFKSLFNRIKKYITNNFVFYNIFSRQNDYSNSLLKLIEIGKINSFILRFHYPPS